MPYIPQVKIGDTTYKMKDQDAWDHMIEGSTTQPTHPANKIWVNESAAANTEVQVPTYDEYAGTEDALNEEMQLRYQVMTSGKNIFNKNTANQKSNVYVAYSSGRMASAEGFVSFAIPVTGGLYVSSNKGGHFSWYSEWFDIHDYKPGSGTNQLPGYINGKTHGAEIYNTKLPDNAKMFVASVNSSDVDGLMIEQRYVSTSNYESYKPLFNGKKIKEKSAPIEIIDKNANEILVPSRNLLDPTTEDKREGVYIVASNGKMAANSDFMAIVLPVEGGQTFSINHSYLHVAFSSEFFMLQSMSTGNVIPGYISGIAGTSQNMVGESIPSNAKYMVLSCPKTSLYKIQVEYGNDITDYEEYGYVVNGNKIRKGTIPEDRFSDEGLVITLKADGTGDYTNLRTAIESLNGLLFDHATIYFEPGIYNMRSWFTNGEWAESGFEGIKIPRNVNLVGKGGKRADVLLTCTSETAMSEVSTLHLTDNHTIKNMTFYANNLRYVCHDDESNNEFANKYGSYRKIENVDFIGENLQRGFVYGAGTRGGAEWHFVNCRFIQKTSGADGIFSVHDRYNTATPEVHAVLDETFVFDDCEFIGPANSDLRLCPANSGVEETVILNHCKLQRIYLTDEYTGHGNVQVPTSFNVLGAGNSKDIEFSYYADRLKKTFPRFSDVVLTGINTSGSTISVNDYCKYDSNHGIIEGTAGDNIGKALNSAASGEIVYMS